MSFLSLSFLDGNIKPLIRQNEKGETVVYPYGIYPKGIFTYGYIVAPEVAQKLSRFLKIYFLLSFVFIFVFLELDSLLLKDLSWQASVIKYILAFILLLISNIIGVKSIIRSAPGVTSPPPSFRQAYSESHKIQAKSYSRITILFMILWSIAMGFIFIKLIFPYNFYLGILGIVLFGVFLLKCILLLKESFHQEPEKIFDEKQKTQV
ncbi:MAG: hypothetical protein HYT11_01335 [Candidatus Levybacteria bacterium]|nr:hypothetical protein [Candidatus Levybacteria bacterium]